MAAAQVVSMEAMVAARVPSSAAVASTSATSRETVVAGAWRRRFDCV